MARSRLVQVNEKIAEKVVGGYKKIEDAVVGGYQKVENAFVDRYLTRSGESVEDAKARLRAQREERQVQGHERMARETAHMPGREQ